MLMENETGQAIELKVTNFEGPLDLLFHLIEKNRIDLYDIPIAQITEQYLSYLDTLHSLDLEIASEFLLMAATLLQIKSRMLLPQRGEKKGEDGEDPREELVLKLLEYRRCKAIAGQLKERHDIYAACQYRVPETPGRLGLQTTLPPGDLDWNAFLQAGKQVARQNELRFNDLSGKLTSILRREKVSMKEKMRLIWRSVTGKIRVYFNELFPPGQSTRAERVTGFLALLELLRLGKVTARQDRPFDVILLETGAAQPTLATADDEALDHFLTEKTVEDKDYE
jgi:segregation and condensation protein A